MSNEYRAVTLVDDGDLPDAAGLRELFAEYDVDGAEIGYDGDHVRDNTTRAMLTIPALEAFALRTKSDDDVATVISDLLADLRHICDALGLDFYALNNTAVDDYDCEVRGEV